MIHVQAAAGLLSRAESVLLRLKRRRLEPYLHIMNAYSKSGDKPHQATRLLHRILNDTSTHIEYLTMAPFTVTIQAWTQASSSRYRTIAFEQAFAALRLTEHDDKCRTTRVVASRSSVFSTAICHGCCTIK
jgi:hypothetical protein